MFHSLSYIIIASILSYYTCVSFFDWVSADRTKPSVRVLCDFRWPVLASLLISV